MHSTERWNKKKQQRKTLYYINTIIYYVLKKNNYEKTGKPNKTYMFNKQQEKKEIKTTIKYIHTIYI